MGETRGCPALRPGMTRMWAMARLTAADQEGPEQKAETERDQKREMRIAYGRIVRLVPHIAGSASRAVELPADPARHVGGEIAGLAGGVGSEIAHVLADILRGLGCGLGGLAGL